MAWDISWQMVAKRRENIVLLAVIPSAWSVSSGSSFCRGTELQNGCPQALSRLTGQVLLLLSLLDSVLGQCGKSSGSCHTVTHTCCPKRKGRCSWGHLCTMALMLGVRLLESWEKLRRKESAKARKRLWGKSPVSACCLPVGLFGGSLCWLEKRYRDWSHHGRP